ncbi:adenylate/guanylate cyclase domain-containing protein [Desertibacillus haloalkaliphilus]|uniref:adenylate/guanylate cyclase domain-containing protein n=1 Tax=Desertibacillus haloalkaliphilus TaxID=1328930 RepID=UPI001C2745F9|nr:adenylate/guanylate cyclase domain-containing protein [Desertibacillus haloalkaliphilus]MBU8905950.1 adenylate/guanylate cyclase domain-containing protein [Desertibacillus haloalkaliphilus]
MRKVIAMIAIFLFVSTIYYTNEFYIPSNALTDRFVHEPRETDPSIKILAIDDESLAEVGRWPWPRDILAEVTDELVNHGATGVFVDVLYTEHSENPAEDEAWQQVLDQHDNVFLPVYFQFDPIQESSDRLTYERINKPIYDVNMERLGHINAWDSIDRVVREVLLGIHVNGDSIIPAMSVRLANLHLEESEQINWNANNEWFYGDELIKTTPYSEAYFSYASRPTLPTFDTYSVSQLINGEVDYRYFKDALVLIGPYSLGLHDLVHVPNSRAEMFGVEVHANMLQSLLDRSILQDVSKAIGIVIILLVTVLAYIMMDRINAKWAIITCIGFIVSYLLLFNTVLKNFQLILPLFYVLLAIVLVYVTSVVSHYLRERHERNRVTGIFGRYVSKSVVTEILANQDEIKLGGERKEVTLLFVDIRGFTTLSENIEPEEVIEILNEYLDLCTKAIFTYEGTLDKFIGDGVMAIYGAPVSQDDHARRAVQSALEMKKKASELATKLEERYGHNVQFGVGINSGPAVIGNIGSKERLEYTAIGDTVNLAARLESNAKPGQILISEDTYELVKGDFQVERLDAIRVKGKEKKVNLYEVKGENE